MTFMAKPKIAHPELPRNALGLTRRDYEGANSTLCAGCGHDSITAAHRRGLLGQRGRAAGSGQALRASAARRRPRRTSSAARTASIPCTAACPRSPPAPMPPTASSTTSASPATATRCRSASGSSATPSAATSTWSTCIENNGVYGLTKGQFSASADIGSHGQEGRGQQPAADRSGAAGDHARRLVRRAQLLGRQGAAGAADPGGDASPGLRADRRALALRDLQRSRGLDPQLRLHARALRGSGARRFRAASAPEIAVELCRG